MAVLGFEGTAHTAGVGVVSDKGEVLSNVIEMYRPGSGGIHPREAADHHSGVFSGLLRQAMVEAGVGPGEIKAIAFSMGPGLGPCLRVTATAARTAALTLGVPLAGVNHCVAHLEIGRLFGAADPVLLYVSGGNTQVIAFVEGRYRVIGETLDIGIGNMLDKLGLSMGMAFPAAPKLERLALTGSEYHALPYSVKGMDVSFSGILTAAQRMEIGENDLAHSVQETAFSMLIEVTERAMAHTGKEELLLGGGVAQNSRLAGMARIMCEERGARLVVPDRDLLRDNGAMIAYTGLLMHRAGAHTPIGSSNVMQRFRTDEVDAFWTGLDATGGQDTPYMEGEDIHKIGAEATVRSAEWHDMPAVSKERLPKGYRLEELDRTLRDRRTRHESRMLREVRRIGVRTPHVFDVDRKSATIVMERIDGPTLRDVLSGDPDGDALTAFGSTLAALHNGGFTHGDPTTSNVIVSGDGLVLIDLSLGSAQADAEGMAVDLKLAREALESTHPGADFGKLLDAYRKMSAEPGVLDRLEDLDTRGRYRRRGDARNA